MPTVTDEFLKNIKGYVETTQPIVKQAAEQAEAVEVEIAPTVDAWIKAGMLDSTKREGAIVRLRDPAFALQSLRKVAERQLETVKEAAPRRLGEGVQTPVNAASSEESADSAWDRTFGVVRPG